MIPICEKCRRTYRVSAGRVCSNHPGAKLVRPPRSGEDPRCSVCASVPDVEIAPVEPARCYLCGPAERAA